MTYSKHWSKQEAGLARSQHECSNIWTYDFGKAEAVLIFICFRMKRLTGYRGVRVGEASHPGPGGKAAKTRRHAEKSLEDLLQGGGAVKLIILLLQILLPGGQAKKLEQVLQGLGPLGELLKGGGRGEGASDANDGGRQKRKRKRKRQQRSGGALATSATPSTAGGGQPRTQQPAKEEVKGKGKEREVVLKGGEGKGKGGGQPTSMTARAPWAEHVLPVLKKEDWKGDLVAYDELADYKGEGPVVVHVKDKEQAEAAGAILLQVAPTVSSTCLWIDGKGTCELPFHSKGMVTPKRVVCIDRTVGAQPLPCLRRAAATAKKLTAPQTSVLRAVVGKQYVQQQDYTELRANAARFFKTRLPVLKDVWGFAEEDRGGGKAIVGLVRVAKGNVEQLLRDSGKNGLFFEPTGEKIPVSIEWHSKGAEETSFDYLTRVNAKKSSYGTVLGRRQLGTREKQEAAKVVKAWRLQGTPVHWTEEFVAEAVREQAGLQSCQVLRKIVRGGKATWILRGICEGDYGMVRVEEEGVARQYWLIPSAPTRGGPVQPGRTVLQQPGSFHFSKELFNTKVESVPTVHGAGEDKDKADSERKRQAVPRRSVPEGTTLEEVPTDGACLAHSLAKAIQWVKQSSKPTASARIRAEIVAHMRRKKQYYQPFWAGGDSRDRPGALASFDDYLSEMEKADSWMGNLEVQAAAEVFGLTIYVIPQQADHVPVKYGDGPFRVAIWYTGKHYDFLKANEGVQYPEAVLMIDTKGASSGGRGGGDERDAASICSGLTLWSRDSKGRPVKRAKVPKEAPSAASDGRRHLREAFAAASNPAGDSQRDGGDDSTREGAEEQGVEASVATGAPSAWELEEAVELDYPPPAPANKRKPAPRLGPGRKTHDSWRCSECGYSTGRTSRWPQMKWTHIHQQHADIADEMSRREAKALLVPWSPACLWKCPVPGCNLGLLASDAGRSLRHRARTDHGKEAHPDVDLKEFYLKAADNSAKATIAKRNKAAANRVKGLQMVRDKGHNAEWLGFPAPDERKKHLIYRIFCSTCMQSSTSAAELAKRDCAPVFWGTKKGKLLERLKTYVSREDVAEDMRAPTQRSIDVIEAAMNDKVKRDKAKDTRHELDVLVWPEDLSIRYVCVGCKAIWHRAEQATGFCKGKGSRRRKHDEISSLRAFAKQQNASGKAARRFLDILGVAHQSNTEQEETEMQSLAAQLRGRADP